ncbi:MAG: sodium-dependent transporter [Gemmatimonadota bacterium]|nr:MAG: sodium-dependent transporter [Gemmatimonadota bacterium]
MTDPAATRSRDSWATRAGFILAAVGSAVGLGNMWRFSYVAAEGGGAAFVLLYLVFVAVIGVPIMTSEFVVGRMSQESPVVAVQRLGGPKWAPLGWMFVFCGFGILSYYSVIAGWTMRYALDATRGIIGTDAGAYFQSVATGVPAIVTHVIFMALTIFIVVAGVKRGLERAALVLMPLLFLLLVALAIWAATLGGGAAGYGYYLRPQLGELLDPNVIRLAAGQAFFSLSLGMGAMMTYASYLTSKENLGREAATVALCDFGVAFVAGLVIFPVIFHFGLSSTIGLGGAISDNTVGTLFIALPAGLDSLGTLGRVVLSTFFIMLFFAALTSSISLLEVVVSAVIDGWGWSRKQAAIWFGVMIALAGLPAAFNLNFLDAADKFVGNFLLIVGGFFTAILVGYTIPAKADAELAQGMTDPALRKAWAFFVRYLSPVLLLIVIWFMLPTAWNALVTLLTLGRG